MKSHHKIKALAGLFVSAMLAASCQAEVTLSDFSSFNLSGTYVQWDSGTFTSGATAFTVQANDFGGGFKNLPVPINASGEDTIQIRLNVNSGNIADKFNIILVDGDGTERAFRFEGIAVGNNQTLTKNVANFLQDNNPGTVSGLNLASLTAFHIQGTFANGNPGQAMNLTFDNLSLIVAPFVPDQIPNGDFEIANGVGWGTTQGTPTYTISGGNLGGHTVLDGTNGFAVLYAFNNSEKTFASLGLAPGDTYTFQVDMKIEEGSNIGGIRLEGPAGYVIDTPASALIGDGTTWETYSFPLTVPNSPAQSKFGLRPGAGSKVAFDNAKIVLPGPDAPLQASIAQGTAVSWTANSTENQYQPQESDTIDGPWTNVGPPITGNTVTSVFDRSTSAYYQVLEGIPALLESTTNGGFEENDGFDEGAEGWLENGFTGAGQDLFQAPQRIQTGAHTGLACMQLKVQNAASQAESGKSLLLQNTANANSLDGVILPGNTYTFSFWAKQISSGVSYVQQYKVAFLNSGSGIVGTTGDVNFTAGPEWTKITVSNLVAPAGAVSALIEIVGLTGAVNNGSGEVHIDDVSLETTGFESQDVIAFMATPTVEISWPSKSGQNYQVQSSTSLVNWANFGTVISGDNSTKAVYDAITPPAKFYKVGEIP